MNPWMPYLDPSAQARVLAKMATITVHSQAIIGIRMAGMMGLMVQAPGEQARMITEKQDAVTESWVAMANAAFTGQGVESIINAGLTPYAERTAANHARLLPV